MHRLLRSENLLVVVLMGLVGFYLYDTVRGSLQPANVIFIIPVALLALGLGVAILVIQIVRAGPTAPRAAKAADPPRDAPEASPANPVARSVAILALFIAYVVSMFWAPFDLVAWLFVLAALLVLGERGRMMTVVYPLVFAFSVALLFRLLLPYPMDTLIWW